MQDNNLFRNQFVYPNTGDNKKSISTPTKG